MPTDAFSKEYKGPYHRVVVVNGLADNPGAVFPESTIVYDRTTRDFYLLAGGWQLLPSLARQYPNASWLPSNAPEGTIAITQDTGGMYRLLQGTWQLLTRETVSGLFSGEGDPDPGLGLVGDSYIDIATGDLWGPKTAFGWGSPTSLVGPQGAKGDAGAGVTWRGPWNELAAYVEFDAVERNGSAWIANADNTAAEPGAAGAWDLWLEKGPKGDTGDATLPNSVTDLELADGAVTITKHSAFPGLSVLGRGFDGGGGPSYLVAGTDGHVMRRSGASVGFGQVAAAGLASNSVLTAKILDGAVTRPKVGDGSIDVRKMLTWFWFGRVTAAGVLSTVQTQLTMNKTGTGVYHLTSSVDFPGAMGIVVSANTLSRVVSAERQTNTLVVFETRLHASNTLSDAAFSFMLVNVTP